MCDIEAFERKLHDYALLDPVQQAQLRAQAMRRAQAERRQAIAGFFKRLAFWRRILPSHRTTLGNPGALRPPR